MRMKNIFTISVIAFAIFMINGICAGQTIQLSTINWEPYTGEKLPDQGFFTEIVKEAFAKVGYKIEFLYRPWARALQEAKDGTVHGIMDAYWKKDRVKYLEYPDVVWKVREEFIALKKNPIKYNGKLADLKGSTIGVLRGSAQAEEIEAAGVKTEAITDQKQNVQKLLAGRIDAMIIPRSIFYYQAESLDKKFNRKNIKVLQPPYKIYDMYVAFSKKKPNYKKITADFNKGLKLIKENGTYNKIIKKHNISSEE